VPLLVRVSSVMVLWHEDDAAAPDYEYSVAHAKQHKRLVVNHGNLEHTR